MSASPRSRNYKIDLNKCWLMSNSFCAVFMQFRIKNSLIMDLNHDIWTMVNYIDSKGQYITLRFSQLIFEILINWWACHTKNFVMILQATYNLLTRQSRNVTQITRRGITTFASFWYLRYFKFIRDIFLCLNLHQIFNAYDR